MTNLSEKNIINGFLENNTCIIKKIYRECYPMIEKLVINTGGNTDQAKDIFQEALMVAIERIKSGQFILKCRFSTFIYAVSKKMWFQERRKSLRKKMTIERNVDMVEEPDEMDDSELRFKEIFERHFNELSKDCQRILKMHFNNIDISEIQEVMEYDNPHYAMDRKYRCKKSLIKRIISDPKFKSIKDEYSGKIRIIH